MMKKLTFILSIFVCFLLVSCKDKEAIKKYEYEKHALELMKIQHSSEINEAIIARKSQWEISLMRIEHAEKEKEQADLVYELAKKAGVE